MGAAGLPSTGQVDVVQGDITTIPADAIVNAANSALAAGGGVCGAIFRAAGERDLADACAAIGGCPTGQAVATPAFGIATARFIVHAVGPIYDRYGPDESRTLLRQAYESAIRAARDAGCGSIAIPALSTGIYGYPLADACREAAEVCLEEARETGLAIKLVAFDGDAADMLRQAVAEAAKPN